MAPIQSKSELPGVLSDFFNSRFFAPWFYKTGIEEALPPANISENEKEFKIELAVPGFKKDDIKIDLDGNVLTISANQKEEQKEENEHYTRKEFSYSSFSRAFTLPESADIGKIEAKYNDGILNLTIAKKADAVQSKKKRINVG
jgi:HSP20 family protein